MRLHTINIEEKTALEDACAVLTHGGLVVLPTETVYGLAADATNGEAVAKIFEAKGRPSFNPLICHVSSLEMARQYVVFDDTALSLANAFWPGPLTLVLPIKPDSKIHSLTRAGLDTLAVRMPGGFARDLIEHFGRPVAAPSANRSGGISATRANHVQSDLGDRVDLVLDGGPASIGLESTIVKTRNGDIELLRPGGLSVDDIERATGMTVRRQQNASAAIEAPGMMTSHYAPRTPLVINATTATPDDCVITFAGKRITGSDESLLILDLSERGDLGEAAANLFDHMKTADASGAERICVVPIPIKGLGEAINDRLTRAAAPKTEIGDADRHD
ncbi:MAG: L-threonylcarbamoyladenylate synthase [Alphaproteobacteria bacterium]|nr:L-threonylcarbamoyladenylate synthase [Alphaproteobacteria bacterium]